MQIVCLVILQTSSYSMGGGVHLYNVFVYLTYFFIMCHFFIAIIDSLEPILFFKHMAPFMIGRSHCDKLKPYTMGVTTEELNSYLHKL